MKLNLLVLGIVVIFTACSSNDNNETNTTAQLNSTSQNITTNTVSESNSQNMSLITSNITITEDSAKKIALTDAGISETEIKNVIVKLSYDDGIQEYEVDFYTDSAKYEYDIEAKDGTILKKDIEFLYNSSIQNNNQNQNNLITEDNAKKIALTDAGIAETEIKNIITKLSYDDEVQKYKVEFYTNNAQYEYDILSNDGTILEKEIKFFNNQQIQNDLITENDAKKIAFNDANVSENEARNIKVEFSYDDGAPEYEIEFYKETVEYEYDISAIDGTILKKDIDFD